MHPKKIIAFILALTFLASSAVLLSSCNKDGSTQTGDGTQTVTTTPEDVPDTPELGGNYDGYEFHILISSRSTRTPIDFLEDTTSDATPMGSAIVARTLAMEEKYGVKIVIEKDLKESHAAVQKMEQQYTAQTNAYDMGVINTYAAAPIATNGHLYDLHSIPYLDLSKEWWDQTVVSDLTMQGSMFYVCGDITTTVDDYMYCTIFNKSLYREHVTDGTDVYKLVQEGKWTLDELARLTKLVQIDEDGNGIMNGKDTFGLMTWNDELYASIQASGGRIAQVNDNGQIELCLYNQKNQAVMEKYMEIHTAPSTINFQKSSQMAGVAWPNVFSNDQAMFFMTILNEVSRFRDMTTDYGILPNPRYTEDQERWYCTFSAGLASFVCVPAYQENIERTGDIIECLGYEAVGTIKNGYYEKTLKGTHVRDDDSIDSLTVLLDNKYVDIGHYYRIGMLNVGLYNVADSGSVGTFASQYEQRRAQAETDIKKINDQYAALKDQ